jgi:hypothetical protein
MPLLRMLKSKLGMNINVMLMMKKLHVDVSQYVTWTSKATWEYGFSYYDYASQIIVWWGQYDWKVWDLQGIILL